VFETENAEEASRWTFQGYLLTQGVLYRYSPDDDTEEPQLVVATGSREHILQKLHGSPEACHFGADHTYYKILARDAKIHPGLRVREELCGLSRL
jgi:hypothetical protein